MDTIFEEGPAVKDSYGTKYWYINGQLHRTDGPAVEYADGEKQWYMSGQRHREDGPAIEDADGTKHWYMSGQLHRTDGPAIQYANGTKYWYVNGRRHRTDGPAIEYADGTKHWYYNGELHSGTTPPVVLLEDDGRKYTLIYVDGVYCAGCRRFDYREAVNHWSNPNHPAPTSAALLLKAVKAHRAEKTIFKFDELSDTAKEKAVSDWRFDDPACLDSSFDLIVEVGEMLGFCFASRGKGEVRHDYSIGSYDDYYYAECSWAHRKGMLADVQKRWGHIHGEPVRKLAQTLHDCQKRFNWQLEVVASTSSYQRRSAAIEVYRLNDQYGQDERQPDQKLILDATDAVTDFFQWAEHLLKADWEFQHSSEYVIDMIEANECEFDENGAMA